MSDAPCSVLVTGGTGFLGAALVRRLVRIGYDVHVLARATSNRSALDGLRVSWHVGDIADPASLSRATRAVSESARAFVGRWMVIHAAAQISYRTRDAAASHAANVDGTAHVLDAAAASGATRLCHVSSVVAVGQAPDAASALDETARFNGAALHCAYVDTKRAAEELALARRGRLEVVVVNPGAVFGPARVPSNTTRFLAHVARSPRWLPFPPGSLAVVGVDDVAQGIVLALERGRPGRRYLLTESNHLVAEIAGAARHRIASLGADRSRAADGPVERAPTLPRLAWNAVVRLATLVDRVRPLEVTTPVALRLLGEHYRFDARRARDELGWSPAPFGDVLDGTLRWMKREGHL